MKSKFDEISDRLGQLENLCNLKEKLLSHKERMSKYVQSMQLMQMMKSGNPQQIVQQLMGNSQLMQNQ